MFGICHACMEWGRGLEGYQSGYQATGQSSLDLKQPQPAVGTLELPWMMDLEGNHRCPLTVHVETMLKH